MTKGPWATLPTGFLDTPAANRLSLPPFSMKS
jgi:hypothetical protein